MGTDCKTMLIFTVRILSVVLVVHGVTEDGFTSRCDSNATLFVQQGKDATFLVEGRYFDDVQFYSGMNHNTLLLYGFIHHGRDFDIMHIDNSINVTMLAKRRLNITLHDVTVERTGMYMYEGRSTYCWELFVIDIWNPQGIQTFEEYRPAFIHATPPASRLVRPRVNATATWLLNGLNYSETTDFLKEDGHIIVLNMPRHLNDKNVTYRILEDNGNMHELQLTLSVTYGPDPYLQVIPTETFYTLTKGDVLPDITCSTDCNPTCQITWDRSGVGNVLSLGQVDHLSSGMYTCQATRNGSDVTVERSIYVEVTGLYVDNTSFIIAVAVLGAILGMTLICLGISAAWMCRTSRRNGTCISEKDAHIARTNRTNQHVNDQRISNIELDHYEDLDKTQSNENEAYENL